MGLVISECLIRRNPIVNPIQVESLADHSGGKKKAVLQNPVVRADAVQCIALGRPSAHQPVRGNIHRDHRKLTVNVGRAKWRPGAIRYMGSGA
jgi:hypothetical protein